MGVDSVGVFASFEPACVLVVVVGHGGTGGKRPTATFGVGLIS